MTDLLYYDYYTKAPHAPVAPFSTVTITYHPRKETLVTNSYFDDPEYYIHMDEQLRFSESREKLDAGCFLGQGLDALGQLSTNDAYRKSLHRREEFFSNGLNTCNTCAAWRVCAGRYRKHCDTGTGCRTLLEELMTIAEDYGKKKNETKNETRKP